MAIINHHKSQSSFSFGRWLNESVPRSVFQANAQRIYHAWIKFSRNFSALFGLIIIFIIVYVLFLLLGLLLMILLAMTLRIDCSHPLCYII